MGKISYHNLESVEIIIQSGSNGFRFANLQPDSKLDQYDTAFSQLMRLQYECFTGMNIVDFVRPELASDSVPTNRN
jgi:hypothetical protein